MVPPATDAETPTHARCWLHRHRRLSLGLIQRLAQIQSRYRYFSCYHLIIAARMWAREGGYMVWKDLLQSFAQFHLPMSHQLRSPGWFFAKLCLKFLNSPLTSDWSLSLWSFSYPLSIMFVSPCVLLISFLLLISLWAGKVLDPITLMKQMHSHSTHLYYVLLLFLFFFFLIKWVFPVKLGVGCFLFFEDTFLVSFVFLF